MKAKGDVNYHEAIRQVCGYEPEVGLGREAIRGAKLGEGKEDMGAAGGREGRCEPPRALLLFPIGSRMYPDNRAYGVQHGMRT